MNAIGADPGRRYSPAEAAAQEPLFSLYLRFASPRSSVAAAAKER
jgi:hypothetical protein